jgi:hypothetical protein
MRTCWASGSRSLRPTRNKHFPARLSSSPSSRNPSTFLSQERWKDTPPAAEPKKGELRLREATPEQAAQEQHEALVRAEYMRLAHPPENKSKSRDELSLMAEQAVRAA